MTAKERIDQLRAELHRHNYNYYILTNDGYAYDDEVRLRITVHANTADLVTSIEVCDQNGNMIEVVSETGHSGSSDFYVVLDSQGETVLDVTPHVASTAGRIISVDTEDGLHVLYENDRTAALGGNSELQVEIVSDQNRRYAVIFQHTNNHVQYYTETYDSFIGDTTITIPASSEYEYGVLTVAYAENSGATPEYGLYIPECVDPNHPSTRVTFFLDGNEMDPGLHRVTSFATLSLEIHSDEPISHYRLSLDSDTFQTVRIEQDLDGATDSECVIVDEKEPLNWLNGDISVYLAIFYGNQYQSATAGTEVEVNIQGDGLSVSYGGQLHDGDSIVCNTNSAIGFNNYSYEPMRVVYNSSWSASNVSIWCEGEFVIDHGSHYISMDKLENNEHVTGVLNITIEPA